MGTLVDSGLGWYLDEDYLLTLGSQTLGTVEGGGGGGSANFLPYVSQQEQVPFSYPITYNYSYVGVYEHIGAGPVGAQALAYLVPDVSRNFGHLVIISNSAGVYSAHQYYTNAGQPWQSTEYYSLTTVDPTTGLYYADFALGTGTARVSDSICYYAASVRAALDDAVGRFSATTSSVTKVQGGAGAFAFVSYPKDGGIVYVGVGISSIPNPNSAATVAVDGTNGSYDTFNREYINFTMYYTPELSGTLTNNVPVVSISDELDASSPLYAFRLFIFVAHAAQIHAGPAPQGEDPYSGGGTSGPGGGGGTFDDTSDTIVDSGSPTFSFAGSGFCRIYNPTLSQLQSLANYLWTDTTFLQTIVNHAKQLLEDPIEAIISLAMLPVSVPQGSSESVKVLFIDTGVSMAPATTQYVEVDCGSYTLQEYYGSALDYNPYTQVDLFLPFIGQVSLNTDEVMGHTISVKYRVDIVSGMCVAKIFVDGNCLYQFSGNCAIFMPLNSADFSSYLSAAITAATALVSAGAGAAAGAAAAGAESIAEPAVQTGGNLLGTGESLVTPQMAAEYQTNDFVLGKSGGWHKWGETPPASLGEMERKLINNTALAVLGSKISFEHASHLAGNSGILGIRRPYLIINRPDMCNPAQYGKYNGRPCMMYLNLGSLSGYTEVQEIQLTGFSATNPELAEISKMLKGGVIL